MARNDRRIGTQKYGGKAPTKYKVAKGGPAGGNALTRDQLTKRKRRAEAAKRMGTAPRVAIAEVEDTYSSLADKYGVGADDLAKANKPRQPKAGTAVNIPNPSYTPSSTSDYSTGNKSNADYNVAHIPAGMSVADWNALQNQQPTKELSWWEEDLREVGQFLGGILTSGGNLAEDK